MIDTPHPCPFLSGGGSMRGGQTTRPQTTNQNTMKNTPVKITWLKLPENFSHKDLARRSLARAYRRGCRYTYFVHCVGNGFAQTESAANESAARKARRACPGNPPCWEVAKLDLIA